MAALMMNRIIVSEVNVPNTIRARPCDTVRTLNTLRVWDHIYRSPLGYGHKARNISSVGNFFV